MIRLISSLFLFFYGSFFLIAQTLPLQEHIDKTISNFSGFSSEYNTNGLKFNPIIKNVQFRTESDEFNLEKQKYAIRTNFLEKSNIENTQLTLNKSKELAINKIKTLSVDYLEILYQNYIKIHFANENKLLYQKAILFQNDIVNVLTKIISKDPTKINDLLEMTASLKSNESLVEKYKNEIIQYTSLINKDIEQNIIYETPYIEELIPINEMLLLLSNFKNSNLLHPELLENKLKTDEEEAKKIALDNRNDPIIDYIQVDYSGPHDNLFQEKVNVSVGVNVFTPKTSNLKMQENLIELKKLEHEKILLQQAYNLEKESKYWDLKLQIDHYLQNNTSNNNSYLELKKITKKLTQIGIISPLNLLNLELRNTLSKIKILEKKEVLYLNYISYLKSIGKIYQNLDKNFLQKDSN